jgi:DNA replicative helicase MCM subunit Mcm2 (Cdc46/Mcm family)
MVYVRRISKGVLDKGFGSPRVVITLPKIAKAIARLKFKNVADGEDAKEAMQFYNATLVKFKKTVVMAQNPQYIAYEKALEIVKRFEKFGIKLEKIVQNNMSGK